MPGNHGPNQPSRPRAGGSTGGAVLRGPPGQYQQRPDERVAEIWPNYLQSGYFRSDGTLNPEMVSREKVGLIADRLTQLTTGQMRRFFGHCRALETRMRALGQNWNQVEADFRKLDVAAEDAHAKRPSKIPDMFYDFIKANVAAVKCEKDFTHGFLPHFEALVGFSAGKLNERK